VEHQKKAEQKDNTPTKSVLQSALQDHVWQIIDAYLQVWAGFVHIGKGVKDREEDKVRGQFFAEIADWWLVWSLSKTELARAAFDWTGRSNLFPFSRTMRTWLCLQVFLALKRNEVLRLTRLEAADRLVERWNPFPFCKKARAQWKWLRPGQKEDLRNQRSRWLVEACEELAEEPARRRRFGAKWLKDAAGQWTECKLEELSLPKPARAVRTAVIKRFEAAILEIFACRSLEDSDGAITFSEPESFDFGRDQCGALNQDDAASVLDNPKSGDESADVVLDDSLALTDFLDEERRELELLEQCPIFTRRQRELISHLRQQRPHGQHLNISVAAREMGIKPDTGWVHWHNIRKKLPRARIWLRTRKQ
jgi:hypothetical protein